MIPDTSNPSDSLKHSSFFASNGKKDLIVTEIFHSLQGESTLAGERFTFIRLTGCPLRCTYCDTKYSYSGGKKMSVDEIVSEIRPHQTKWVCLTGGEPLVQKNALALVQNLKESGYQLTIETDGQEDIKPFVNLARIIADVKTPSSGESHSFRIENLPYLDQNHEVKFVIGSREDYDFAVDFIKKYLLTKPEQHRPTILFSNVFDQITPKTLASWILQDKLPVRQQLQLHKYIWEPSTRGV